jgi:hypothetical protein
MDIIKMRFRLHKTNKKKKCLTPMHKEVTISLLLQHTIRRQCTDTGYLYVLLYNSILARTSSSKRQRYTTKKHSSKYRYRMSPIRNTLKVLVKPISTKDGAKGGTHECTSTLSPSLGLATGLSRHTPVALVTACLQLNPPVLPTLSKIFRPFPTSKMQRTKIFF